METLLPGISVGAVGAAFIAAVVSVLGLVISKESKVSDFRQAWIDALRSEITSYLSSINLIYDASQINYANHEDKVAKLSAHYAALNTANFMISLRLNPKEENAKKILKCMSDFQNLLSAGEINSDELRRIEREFLISSKKLLKHEWSRVKSGEKTYKVVKLLMMGTIVAIVTSAAFEMALYKWREIALSSTSQSQSNSESEEGVTSTDVKEDQQPLE